MRPCLLVLLFTASLFTLPSSALAEDSMLTLHARKQVKVDDAGKTKFVPEERELRWEPQKTALIVVDMWDDHWCKGAANRVVELAEPMNDVVKAAREQGVFIIHAPSTTVDFYKDTPARKRAIKSTLVKTPAPLATEQRWGTAWLYPDKKREAELPIDDSDMGCDCKEKCEIKAPWKRQIATIEIDDKTDAITDNGQELYNLLAERKIDHVMIMGVHLNMCVLGRPFGIRQLTNLGKDVVLVRDMTDTMYNHEKRPFVDHFSGTDLMIGHVEKYWCPTITSTDIIGGKPFRFKEDRREKR